MQDIPLNDLGVQHAELREELDRAVRRVVDDARFIGGPDHQAFAREFAEFCDVRRAVPCSSGTDALALAILGVCGLGDGTREIVTVSFTFPATVEVIALLGYRPVLVDIEPYTYMMDLTQLEDVITPRTAAIIPVHLFGQMLPVNELVEFADAHDIPVIEDAAQAHGARWDGVSPGQCSSAATFSFFPAKNLGAWGDAGAVVTQDEQLARRLTSLANHGRTDKHTHSELGLNARMDNLQAAVLRVKLRHLARWNSARRRAARWYGELLDDIPGCVTPFVQADAHHVYHQYVIQIDERDEIAERLSEEGIGCGVHYASGVHEQPAFSFLDLDGDALPVTSHTCDRVLSLPMHPYLTRAQVQRVCDVVRRSVMPSSTRIALPVATTMDPEGE